MSVSTSAFSNLLTYTDILSANELFETRLDNDISGNVLYIGQSITPSADTSLLIWNIRKLSYDVNGFVNYIQLPTNGAGFLYAWDDRATYF